MSQHPSSYVSNAAVNDSGCRVNAGCLSAVWLTVDVNFYQLCFRALLGEKKVCSVLCRKETLFCQKLGFILILTEESTCMNTLVFRHIVVRKTGIVPFTPPERLQELSVRDHQGEKTALKTQLERNTTYVGCVLVLVLVFFSSQVVTA